jgi:hypothetical protein
MSVKPQRPPGLGPPDGHNTSPWPSGRPLWQQFLIGAVVVLLVVGVILAVVRLWAIPTLQSRGSDAGVAGAATLGALQTQQALTPRPTTTSLVAPALQPTSAATPTAGITTLPTVVLAPAPTAAPTARPTAQPTAASAAQPTRLPGSATSATGTVVPSLNGTPYPLPTAPPDVTAAVSQAYLRYWSVRADALLSLDPAGLDQVAAQDELAALESNIESDRAQGRALKTDVQHQFSVLTVIDDQAVVTDHFRDSSIYVAAGTRDPLPGQVAPASPDQAPEVGVLYKLQLIDGTWKVVQGQLLS